ncbi:hypothetical protein OU798_21665 [Prolixibacteraceae bacterium Z1-6]|uniref:Uncharacterized protein n=1 Tax=Draconibacterium aestuarii TaxID=2998507 RepID=A0A9X3J9N7_9BACT|nr:hypothetical protein [Prolixibacteraceae bacterium Z1-6]
MEQNKQDTVNLNTLTARLKNEDERYARLSKNFQIVYWVLVAIYGLLIGIHIYENQSIKEIAGITCFLLAMLIFAIMFRHFNKEYATVDYSQPTLLMLKQAAHRYKPFQLKTIWALVAVLLIDAGLSLNESLGFDLIRLQIVFVAVFGIAFAIGLVFWKIRYKALRDDALLLIRELENDVVAE